MGECSWSQCYSAWSVNGQCVLNHYLTPVMIVSYETLRTLQDELANCPIGLLLADEGHRLKNAGESCALDTCDSNLR